MAPRAPEPPSTGSIPGVLHPGLSQEGLEGSFPPSIPRFANSPPETLQPGLPWGHSEGPRAPLCQQPRGGATSQYSRLFRRHSEGPLSLSPPSTTIPRGCRDGKPQKGRAAGSVLRPGAAPSCLVVPVRTRKKKSSAVPEWARELTPEEKMRRLKSQAPIFPDEHIERTFYLASTADIIDPYVPPEGDARLSTLSKEGLKQKMDKLKQTAASQLALRKIKDHDPNFSTKTFPEKAQEIFIEAHNSLANFNKQKLHSLVTERCYPDMVRGNRYKTIRWSFVESLEPPRVVHVRCDSLVNKGNLYGQVTVRMHTRQILAIYDRFGRLMYGGEQVPKDVLEYVVFERYLVNPYGSWRMHGKIVPEWAPPKDPIVKTVMIPGPTLDPSQEYEEVK
ncbi:39S ribosomal protein L45, mitochondrial isoform X1 [Neopelma chrysocephalum]|uniref:39S ribosomal protein L45, mitochondrial isoform X1 n=1 Tax=Neopelma chrysocephalum TaxID=114329 RepID=UPI000FCCF966|nr:39S ribosomal protein L45, mitochondrial isoform X1 [Neopelma chrysocephalum]